MVSKLCAPNLFCRDSELQIYHRNFLITDNKHGKSFAVWQSEGCKFMRKMQIHLAVGLRPDPLMQLIHSPRPHSQYIVVLSRDRSSAVLVLALVLKELALVL